MKNKLRNLFSGFLRIQTSELKVTENVTNNIINMMRPSSKLAKGEIVDRIIPS